MSKMTQRIKHIRPRLSYFLLRALSITNTELNFLLMMEMALTKKTKKLCVLSFLSCRHRIIYDFFGWHSKAHGVYNIRMIETWITAE